MAMRQLVLATLGALACVLALGIALVWLALQPPAPLRPTAEDFVLRDVTIVRPAFGRDEHQSISVHDGRIRLGDSGSGAEDPETRIYRGMYVLPGLVDMHAHLPPGN